MKTTLLAGLALAMTASFATAAGDEWMTDFEAAKKKAATENKDLLLNFTGSDWCRGCLQLIEEVFKHDEFKKGVADKFILVELDYPMDTSKLSEAIQKQNKDLQEKHNIQGFPTILLLDAKGRPFAQTGYQPGGSTNYLTHLNELRAVRIKRDESLAAADKLTGVEKAKALIAVLKTLPEAYLSHYSGITEQIAKLNPKDESGFVADQKRKAAEAALEKEVITAMKSGETDEAIASIDKFIIDYKIEGEEKQELLSMKIDPLLNAKKYDDAAKILADIIALAPESKAAKHAESFKPHLQKMKEAASKPTTPNPPHGQPGHRHGEH